MMAKGGAAALPRWKALLHWRARWAAETGAARRAGMVVMLKLTMYAVGVVSVRWFRGV